MNKGVLQSSPVQQMMAAAGNPNWWYINSMRPPPTQQSSPFLPPPPNNNNNNNVFPQYPSSYENQELPESWSQLLLGRMVDEEDKSGMVLGHFQNSSASSMVNVKQENNSYFYGHANEDHHHFQQANWSQVMPSVSSSSSPNNKSSSVTSFSSNNMLDFTSSKVDPTHPPPDRSSESNSSTVCGGVTKKARVQSSSSSTQSSTFKVRKEKLGDRITTLHQLVSPFGKTDTASVLLEAIGYIRFLQSQIEALSLPYLGSGSANMRQSNSHSVHGERNCIFPEDPGQLLNDNCMKRKGTPDQESSHEEPKKDLRSRGLCLVPISCTLQVGSDNGADYWAPVALGGTGFR